MNKLDDTIYNVAYILDTLTAYRSIVESGNCNDCVIKNSCKYAPKPGQLVRYNCPFYEERKTDGEETDRKTTRFKTVDIYPQP